ncbi:MAG: NADH-quinone oxidoreductase subunit L [Methylococcales bacterium]|jgi:NADH-quinone oxidoreductase subunit L|nr:NADH-quinone oxidoreductase subunit L [Methylococcales bacterium]MBT7408210.1 NADH-quinone oxidoreductase subunit L [Methylococcales bacterium]
MKSIYILIVLSPLIGSIITGLFGKKIGRVLSHRIAVLGVTISCLLSLYVLKVIIVDQMPAQNLTLYTWLGVGDLSIQIGFLVDKLTALMMCVVTFVSLMVHIYTIGYMHDDKGYQRFFSYISLFTFSMLMLVMSNNFLQLFFGWEAVGLVSYLLIGFWFEKDSAIFANMKAFLVNRVGDFGFLLGIAAIYTYCGSLDYDVVFSDPMIERLASTKINVWGTTEWTVITMVSIMLFVGAMGKSAQIPLHVWLPDSMEGPTPISALIHAATMVTAGIFMVARTSALFEMSDVALNFVIVIGALTAFLMGLIGIVQNDIKRVVAYSTLSQLGYMTVALGVSAYTAGIFHLMTHAFFKALLFLGAGSVIIAMHHDQDMRNMGGLKKYMPITYWTSLIGSLALIGFPFTSGFFSKDAIIHAVHLSKLEFAPFAYILVTAGVFITAFYTFRMFFMVFHGEERMDQHTKEHLKEPSWVVTMPLILLAIPSLVIGGLTVENILFGEYLKDVIHVMNPDHQVMSMMTAEFHGLLKFVWHGLWQPPFILSMCGVGLAWFIYIKKPSIAETCTKICSPIYKVLDKKYGFDEFNDVVFASGGRKLGGFLWKIGDVKLIDGLVVNGSAKLFAWLSEIIRKMQTGFLYHYAFVMILGLLGLLAWILIKLGIV